MKKSISIALCLLLSFSIFSPTQPCFVGEAHASTQPTESPLKSMWNVFGPLLEWLGVSSHDWSEWGDEQCWDADCNQCNPQPEEDESEDGEEDGDDPTTDGGEWL